MRHRRQALALEVIAKLVGAATLVLTVASVFYVLLTDVDRTGPRTAPQHPSDAVGLTPQAAKADKFNSGGDQQ
jgi:hypothetical protein